METLSKYIGVHDRHKDIATVIIKLSLGLLTNLNFNCFQHYDLSEATSYNQISKNSQGNMPQTPLVLWALVWLF